MGVCLSCLGRDGDHDLSDEDEQSRLLFDDPHANHYGSFGDNNAGTVQVDPQDVQRENEALQMIVNLTSSRLVDIFATAPQNNIPLVPSHTTTAQDARSVPVPYRDVLAKISVTDLSSKPHPYPIDHMPITSDSLMPDNKVAEETRGYTPVKTEGIKSLLGGFEDADSAMV